MFTLFNDSRTTSSKYPEYIRTLKAQQKTNNLMEKKKKMDKIIEQALHQEDIWMTREHIKSCQQH